MAKEKVKDDAEVIKLKAAEKKEIEKLINTYSELDKDEKAAKKEKAPLGDKIKEMFSKLGLKKYKTSSGAIASLSISESVSFDSAAIMEFMKSKKIKDYIVVSESLDWEKIKMDMSSGSMDKELIGKILETEQTTRTNKLTVK